MAPFSPKVLKPFAKKYIWWKSPKDSLETPERVAAQVMDIGTFEDIKKMVSLVGEKFLRQVLKHAEVGWFNERSWHFWHYRLGMAKPIEVPPMKQRKLP